MYTWCRVFKKTPEEYRNVDQDDIEWMLLLESIQREEEERRLKEGQNA